jgi:predicted dehydrogenase
MIRSLDHPSQPGIPAGGSPRIAVIGCGAIAESYYLPALARHAGILEALILVDQNIDRAQRMAAAFNVKQLVADYREVLEKVDGVIIALPTLLHHPISREFLSRGVPALCEKPLAESLDKAMEMVELAHKMAVPLATNYQQRLWPQFVKVKELVADRSLGEPVHIKYQVGDGFSWPTVSGFYFNAGRGSRGVLLDRGAHVLDHICWWLGGRPSLIRSQNDSLGGIDAVASVQFARNKCVGEVTLSWLSRFPGRFRVEFERGSIEGEVYYPQSVLMKQGTEPQKRVKLNSATYVALGYRMVDNFIGVLAGSENPLVPASDVLDSIAFTDECYGTATRFDMPWYTDLPGTNE